MRARKAAALLVSAAFAAVGGPTLMHRRRRQRGDYRIVILEYHDTGPDGARHELLVSASRFRRHLRYLRRYYRLVSLSEAVAMLAKPGELLEDAVVVTLDDGYLGNYRYAWPILCEEGVPATIFLCTGFLDGSELWFDLAERCLDAAVDRRISLDALNDRGLREAIAAWSHRSRKERVRSWLKSLPPARRDALLSQLRPLCEPLREPRPPLTWEAVREMQRSRIEVGCHTVSHPTLSTLPARRQAEEIVLARDRITAETGAPPSLFAYPNGAAADFTDETVSIVRDAGFLAACTTRRVSNRAGCDPFRLGRIGVGSEPCVMLAARLAGLFDEHVRTLLSRYELGVRPRLMRGSPVR
jgi:peptidoglycan/xylan/chitin deacetylase (PgdA/CDA1 family)